MTEAIFGLVGVVVGALLTWGVEVLRMRRDERAAALVAARLLSADLGDAVAQIDEALAAGARWPQEMRLATHRWPTHETILARRLDESAWLALAAAFSFLEGVNQFDLLYRSSKPKQRFPLDDQDTVQLQLARQHAIVGIAVLRMVAAGVGGRPKVPTRLPEIAELHRMLIEFGFMTPEQVEQDQTQ